MWWDSPEFLDFTSQEFWRIPLHKTKQERLLYRRSCVFACTTVNRKGVLVALRRFFVSNRPDWH